MIAAHRLLLVALASVSVAACARKPADDEHVETVVPVHVAKVVKATLHRYVDGVGTVSPEPASGDKPAAGAQVAAPVPGIVVQARCAEGMHVEKGALLFELDARTATAEEQKAVATRTLEQSKVARATSAFEFQQRELERVKRLTKEGLASARDLSEAEAKNKAALDDLAAAQASVSEAGRSIGVASAHRSLLQIKAPLSGTVVHVFVRAGEAVDVATPATILAEIVDLDRLVVMATVPAVELPSLKIGQPADLFVAERAGRTEDAGAATLGRKYEGRLSFIGFEVDRKTDSVPVRVSFAPNLGLRPGQYLRLRIAVEERADRLAVPAASVAPSPEGGFVVSVVEGDRAVQRAVTVGLTEAGLTEVEGAGLVPGMTVVTAGAYGLPADTKVRILGGS